MLLPITVMIVFSNLSRDIRPSRLEGKFATEGHWAGFLVIDVSMLLPITVMEYIHNLLVIPFPPYISVSLFQFLRYSYV